jgi:hypothetical protein
MAFIDNELRICVNMNIYVKNHLILRYNIFVEKMMLKGIETVTSIEI